VTVELAELDLRLGPDFFTPFTPSTSTDIADPQRRTRLPVSLGGRDYVLDLKQYQRASQNPFRNAQDPTKEPGEQTLSVEGVWKRTQFSWHHGAGQEFADDDGSDRERFWESRHVDVWTKRKACLLPDTDLIYAAQSMALVAGVTIYVSDGTDVFAAEIANDTALASPTWVDQTPTHGPLDWATDGDHVFYATGATGVYVTDSGTPGDAVLNVAPLNADRVWFANGWLLVADGPRLVSVAADGTQTPVYEHQNDSWTWEDVAGAPNAIYALGHDSVGTQSAIFKITVADDGSQLNVPVFAGDLPIGETGKALFYYQARLCIGTDQGARFAAIDSGGSLNVGPVILIGQINDFAAYGRFVYGAGTPGLWRFNIATEIESLVPAYASDLESATPQHATVVISTIVGILFIDDDLLAPARDRYCAEGTITTGWFGMGSPERKVLSSGSVRAEPLPGDGAGDDATITMEAEDDAGTLAELGVLDTPGTRDPGLEWGGQNLDSEVLRITFTLRATALTQGDTPCLRRMTMRMLIAPVNTEEILAPLLIADKVSIADGKKEHIVVDPFAEFRFLKQLEDSRQVVNYREGQVTYRVTVRGVQIQAPERWTKDRRFFDSVVMVRLVTEQGVPPDTSGGSG
jgi:hypothetical protein